MPAIATSKHPTQENSEPGKLQEQMKMMKKYVETTLNIFFALCKWILVNLPLLYPPNTFISHRSFRCMNLLFYIYIYIHR